MQTVGTTIAWRFSAYLHRLAGCPSVRARTGQSSHLAIEIFERIGHRLATWPNECINTSSPESCTSSPPRESCGKKKHLFCLRDEQQIPPFCSECSRGCPFFFAWRQPRQNNVKLFLLRSIKISLFRPWLSPTSFVAFRRDALTYT